MAIQRSSFLDEAKNTYANVDECCPGKVVSGGACDWSDKKGWKGHIGHAINGLNCPMLNRVKVEPLDIMKKTVGTLYFVFFFFSFCFVLRM